MPQVWQDQKTKTMSKYDQIKYAEQQLIGYTHASQGWPIISLADEMGMTKSEWKYLRKDMKDVLSQEHVDSLDKHFEMIVKKEQS